MERESHQERRIVLASGSPRRLALLRGLGFDPVVRPADLHEQREPGEDPAAYTRRLSLHKAQAVAARRDPDLSQWILAADTIVVLDGDVLEKPVDRAVAAEMLGRLAGRWHTVFSSFTILDARNAAAPHTQTVAAEVEVRALSDGEIRRYVATGEPLDKAGAYGIQDLGSFIVRQIRGSYFAVVGLPICELIEALVTLGAIRAFPFQPVHCA